MIHNFEETDTYENRFLSGGGEMGKLMRSYDWSKSPIGIPELWPQSLRTTLSIILASKFPMFLFWGPELICFYNDAYRPSLGKDGKHPHILGMPGEQAWPEIWPIIKPLIDQVLDGRGATWSEDQLIPIYRNGKIEDVYWTFSYSPVVDESSQPAGVFVTCTETTDKILNLKKLKEKEEQFSSLIIESPVATTLLTGPDFVFELANNEALKLLGKDKSVLGKKFIDALPELIDQPYLSLLHSVFTTGETYHGNESLVYLEIEGKLQPVFVNFIFKAVYDREKKIYGVLAMGVDVTEQIEARKKIQYSEERLRLAVDTARLGTFDINIVTKEAVFSDRVFEIFGLNKSQAGYQELINALHPDDAKIREEANKKAGTTGYVDYEIRIIKPDQTISWIHLHGKAFYSEDNTPVRAIGTVMDITVQKNFLDELQSVERKFRNTVQQAPVGIVILSGSNFVVEMANRAYLELVDRKENEFVGKPLFETLPEVKIAIEPLLKNVLTTGIPYQGIEFPVMINRWGRRELSYFNFVYQALKDESGTITGIIVVASDVTASVKAKLSLAESEKQFRNFVMQSPIAMAIFKGKNFVIEAANETLLNKIWFRKREEVIGKKLLEVFPELIEQSFPALLNQVLETGIVYRENEAVAFVNTSMGMKKYYLDFEYAPLYETDPKPASIMVTVYDVTEKVEARHKVEDAEERLRLAAEWTGFATFDLNMQTDEMIHSPRLLEILGVELTSKPTHKEMRKQLHPDDVVVLDRAFKNALETGVYEYEVRVVKTDGGIRWVKTIARITFDDARNPIRMIGTIRDITEQKLASDFLKSSEEKFRLLADSTPQLIWTADPDGNINYYNMAVYDYSGMSFEELKDTGWIKLVHPDDVDENMRRWNTSVANGSVYNFEHRLRRHDGEYRWQLSRAVPQKDHLGNIQMWVGTSTDIHEMKELEQQKDYFISMASHELKTPITSVKGYVQLLQSIYETSNDSFLKNSLNTVDKQISTLTKLISELLDLSKIKAGTLHLSKETFDLNELTKEAVEEMKYVNPGHQFLFESDKKQLVFADRQRISQVLINLLTNAVKYSPNSNTIRISSNGTVDHVKITVQDNGIGISKEDQHRIFDRFYRVEGKNEKTFPGFGIGLFIASEIVQRHDGQIGVQSEPGKGSAFYFSLPVQKNT